MASTRSRKAAQSRRRNKRRGTQSTSLWQWIGWGAAGGGVLAIMVALFIWLPAHWAEKGAPVMQNVTAALGFRVNQVMIVGRQEIPLEDIQAKLGVERGMPLFSYSTDALAEHVKAISKIKNAVVIQRWPDTLLIQVRERMPVARWQHDKQVQIIDPEGIVLGQARPQDNDLPLIVGDAAPQAHEALWPELQKEPELYNQVRAAVYVGQRRWDLILKNDTRIKLPSHDIAQALQHFWQQPRRTVWMAGGAETIDLRLEDKIVIRPVAQPVADDHLSAGPTIANPA